MSFLYMGWKKLVMIGGDLVRCLDSNLVSFLQYSKPSNGCLYSFSFQLDLSSLCHCAFVMDFAGNKYWHIQILIVLCLILFLLE